MTSKKLTRVSKNSGTIDSGRAAATSRSSLIMKCPTCGIQTVYSNANQCRPFCSRNCKVNDLAAWASDEYRVPESNPAGRQPVDDFDNGQNHEQE